MYINIYVHQSKPLLPARSPLSPAGPVSPSPDVCSSPLPGERTSYISAGGPWLGASASRYVPRDRHRAQLLSEIFLPAPPPPAAQVVRSSNMVITTPSTASAVSASARIPLDGVKQLRHTLERKVLRLHRDRHPHPRPPARSTSADQAPADSPAPSTESDQASSRAHLADDTRAVPP